MMTNRIILAATLAALVPLTACSWFAPYDPLIREGLWNPVHVNRANLTMMAANPADLVHGTGEAGSDGQLAAAAVERLHTDKVKKLPDAGLSQIQVTGQGGSQ